MASPSQRALSTTSDATATNITPVEPTGAAENDILVAHLYIESDTGVTAPSLWSNTFRGTVALQECDTASNTFRHYAYWIRRGASAPALTWTHASAFRGITVIAFQGCVTTEDPFSFFTQSKRDDTTARTYPDLSGTTLTADELLSWVGRFYTEPVASNTQPTGWTERQDGGSTSALIADLAQAVAGGTGTVTGAIFGAGTDGNHPTTDMMMGLKSVAEAAGGGGAPLAVFDRYYRGMRQRRPAPRRTWWRPSESLLWRAA